MAASGVGCSHFFVINNAYGDLDQQRDDNHQLTDYQNRLDECAAGKAMAADSAMQGSNLRIFEKNTPYF